MSSCSVYVIGPRDCGDVSAVKVGISSNAFSRLQSIQTGNPQMLKIWAEFALPTRGDAEQAERNFHSHFCIAQLEGEWFEMNIHSVVYMAAMEAARIFPSASAESAAEVSAMKHPRGREFLAAWWNDVKAAEGLAA